jgi:hypothetical protein
MSYLAASVTTPPQHKAATAWRQPIGQVEPADHLDDLLQRPLRTHEHAVSHVALLEKSAVATGGRRLTATQPSPNPQPAPPPGGGGVPNPKNSPASSTCIDGGRHLVARVPPPCRRRCEALAIQKVPGHVFSTQARHPARIVHHEYSHSRECQYLRPPETHRGKYNEPRSNTASAARRSSPESSPRPSVEQSAACRGLTIRHASHADVFDERRPRRGHHRLRATRH